MRKIFQTATALMLSFYLGCAKPNPAAIHEIQQRKPSISDYLITEENFPEELSITAKSKCELKNVEITSLTDMKGLVARANQYRCHLPREPQEGDRYVVTLEDYFIVIKGVRNKEVNIDELCTEPEPYISVIRLNNGKIVYFIDTERDGEPDYVLRGDFPREETPKPTKQEFECPKKGLKI